MGVLGLVSMLFGRRAKFFYYLLAFSLDKMIVNFMKLAYNQPRPYMASNNIYPFICSKEFGKPSGHSLSACLISIFLFLDLFHGEDIDQIIKRQRKRKIGSKQAKKSKKSESKCLKRLNYSFWIIIALGWATLIPFSRYALGVHSLD